jgi:ABC-type lipoprotein export system ATPase subunit
MNSDEQYIARLVDVTKKYEGAHGGTVALKDISFSAGPGEMILLLGPSGSGKTTFLTILAGLQRQTSGDAYLFNKKTDEYTRKEMQTLRALKLGFIFQTFCLLDSLTVIQNVIMAGRFAGTSREEAKRRAKEYLQKFDITHLSDSFPSQISQGEKQRVAIARALVNGAELIIADEPTGSLATKQGMEIVEFLKQSSLDDNRCVVIASHDERIIKYADRVLYLSDGELR